MVRIATGRTKLSELLEEERVENVSGFSHIEGVTQGAGEEVDDVAGGAIGMDVDKRGEVVGRTAGVYGAGFRARSLARIGARDRTQWLGIDHPETSSFFR